MIEIHPQRGHRVPLNKEEGKLSFPDELEIQAATAELISELGPKEKILPLDYATEEEKALFKQAITTGKADKLNTPILALAARDFIRHYGSFLTFDIAQARAAITAKLMEIADCGDTRYELKALELLGKHVDIGLFSDKSEVTVKYKDHSTLARQLKDKIERLFGAEIGSENNKDLDDTFGFGEVARLEKIETVEYKEVEKEEVGDNGIKSGNSEATPENNRNSDGRGEGEAALRPDPT